MTVVASCPNGAVYDEWMHIDDFSASVPAWIMAFEWVFRFPIENR